MREIKFRLWCRRTSTMKNARTYDYKNPDECPKTLKGKDCPAEFFNSNGDKTHISDAIMDHNLGSDFYIMMQYTGLKDKNGKEIYEDDILQDVTGRKHRLKWDGIGWDPFIGNMEHKGDGWHYTIIGNIYENPELLKVSV